MSSNNNCIDNFSCIDYYYSGTMKRKLNDQTSELREYKERVRDLQDQLIKVCTVLYLLHGH